jgi:hypothetical protein
VAGLSDDEEATNADMEQLDSIAESAHKKVLDVTARVRTWIDFVKTRHPKIRMFSDAPFEAENDDSTISEFLSELKARLHDWEILACPDREDSDDDDDNDEYV